jgi:hypothetical protein
MTTTPSTTTPAATTPDCHYVGFDAFSDDCTPPADAPDAPAPDNTPYVCPPPLQKEEITSDVVHRLAVIHKLLEQTGLPLAKLLTFWADIGTVGEQSLYARLFLTHNMVALDNVFLPDANGNYLTRSTTIQDHVPVLMAALGLKASEIAFIANPGPLVSAGLTDLTLTDVTILYRHGLLARLLHVKVMDLPEVFVLLSNPFQDPDHLLELLQTWGKIQDAGLTFGQVAFAATKTRRTRWLRRSRPSSRPRARCVTAYTTSMMHTRICPRVSRPPPTRCGAARA